MNGVAGWQERIWRNINVADISRGKVQGARPFSVFGERNITGAAQDHILWETGMPNNLTVPQGVQMSFVSTTADTRRLKMVYLDGQLSEREEVVVLTGTIPVLTQADDIRFINSLYSLDGAAGTTVTVTSDGVQYARINPNELQFNKAVYRVPSDKRLMLNAFYAGTASSSADARVVVKARTSFFNGDSFVEQSLLQPMAGIALQDNAATLPFGPFPVPPGEMIAFTVTSDKAAKVLGGFFGWVEDV